MPARKKTTTTKKQKGGNTLEKRVSDLSKLILSMNPRLRQLGTGYFNKPFNVGLKFK